MGLTVAQLDGADAAEVVEEARDLVVGGVLRELGVGDEQIGLGDVRREKVVSEEQHNHGGLGVDVLAQHGGS